MALHHSLYGDNAKKKNTKKRKKYTRKRTRKKPCKLTTSSSLSTSLLAEFYTSSTIDTSLLSDWPNVSEPSWNFDQFDEITKSSSYFLKWKSRSTGLSADPGSTTSSGRPSPDLSGSELTITMLSFPGVSYTESVPVTVPGTNRLSRPIRLFDDIDGLSVWSMESYTSTTDTSDTYSDSFLSDTSSQVIQVNYPWSPRTCSGSNISSAYPSSISLGQYGFPSRESLKTICSVGSTDTLPFFGLSQADIDSYMHAMKVERSTFSNVPIATKV